MRKILFSLLLITLSVSGCESAAGTTDRVTISVQNAEPGAPVKFGIPFPKGELYSQDRVRVLNARGEEIASQLTTVNTWEPADESIKWLWVFFFADESEKYQIVYGVGVQRTGFTESPIDLKNKKCVNGFAEIHTCPLLLRVDKCGSGFIARVLDNTYLDGFSAEHTGVTGSAGRGSFLDLLDDAGPDTSRSVMH